MELRQLRHFVVLAEEMHFGRAAKRLYMTQPALSTSVMRLEEELQVRLFDRDSKTMAITPVGTAMLVRAKEIVWLSDRLEQFGKAMGAGKAGVIDLGFTGTLLYRGLSEILNRFSSNYPAIELSVREISSQVQLDMVRAGRLDAAFVNSPVPPAGLASLPLFEERFVACLPASHPLSTARRIDVRDLQRDVFVMFSRDPSPAYYDHVVALCAAAGFEPKVRVAATQVLSIVALVASGLGVSLVPESVSKAGIAGVVYVPLRGVDKQPSAFLAWNPQRDVPGLQALVDIVEEIANLNRP
ncbi:LysR family transcriptional regulator [Pigmentiphaga sp. H8]|uniref:LysR family transcriptional regulator n=1 Tax=Pigmentiphaga sp. H8 TaxID=2488560 RepID=UPI000F5944D8|nr:LysR family transcriptional regulator [Pigmentiphaga sp. H8]AZG08245.1 LysR family transcriptional regulator [Pigmentiphaga sp. H8]